MSVEAGTHLSINCSCSNAYYVTYLWDVNLQNYTNVIYSGTVNRILSHPVSFVCCQHIGAWQCSRPLYINLTQQEIQGMCYVLWIGFDY